MPGPGVFKSLARWGRAAPMLGLSLSVIVLLEGMAPAHAQRLDDRPLIAQAKKPEQPKATLRSRPAVIPEGEGEEPEPPESFTKGFKALWDDSIFLVTAPARMTLNDTLVVGAVLAGIGGLMAADHGVRYEVQKNTSSGGRDVADGFSAIGSPIGVLALNAGLIVVGVTSWSYTGNSRLKDAALVSLESEIFSLVSVFVIKEIAGRATPSQGKGTTHFHLFGGDDSFPSGHAAVSFATAAVFADRFDQPIAAIAYGLATAVALSRVYNDKHFLSDVVAGGALGWIIGKTLSVRHRGGDSDIEIRPLTLDRGQPIGLMVVKPF